MDLLGRFLVECKVPRDSDRKSLEWTVEQDVKQTLSYIANAKRRGIWWCSTATAVRRNASMSGGEERWQAGRKVGV